MKKEITLKHLLMLSLKTSLCFFVFFVSVSSVPIFNVIKAYENQIKKNSSESVILFEDVAVDIEKISSPKDMQIGLSKYSSLSENAGMFFVFDKNDYHGIWMKDMKFPIDIIWLDESLRIVHIKENATPESFPESFVPPQKARYILEVNAGFVAKNYLKVGNQADLFLKP